MRASATTPLNPRALVRLLVPIVLAVLAVLLFQDPTYRLPVLTLLLPLFVRGAAASVGLYEPRDRPSVTVRVFSTFGFAAFVVGWLLVFAVVGFVIAVGVFGQEPSGDLLRRVLFIAAAGLILAAWFLWPWYAREVLSNWPRQELRIWTASGNRWDRVFTAWRLQQMAASAGTQWRGFGATALVVSMLMVLAAIGVNEGALTRLVEIGALLMLAPAHLMIVVEAHALCERWSEHLGRHER